MATNEAGMVNQTSLSRVRCCLPILMLLAGFALNAQNAAPGSAAGSPQGVTQVTKLVVLVDGSKHPEQIPDDLAYRHYFLAIATHEQPSAEEQARQKAQLAPLGLSELDRQQLAQQLGRMTTQLEAIEAEMEASDGTDAVLAAFKARHNALVSQTAATVRGALSPDGLSRLSRYIAESVKGKIKIYGSAN